jgi:hypothetical protein
MGRHHLWPVQGSESWLRWVARRLQTQQSSTAAFAKPPIVRAALRLSPLSLGQQSNPHPWLHWAGAVFVAVCELVVAVLVLPHTQADPRRTKASRSIANIPYHLRWGLWLSDC